MQRSPQVDLLSALRATPNDLEVPRDGPALLVVHGAGLLIADPGVRATTARVHPYNVLETEVVAQRGVEHLDRHGHELPAFQTNVGLIAARADAVVVRQIDIET